jgi:hypothetical protein
MASPLETISSAELAAALEWIEDACVVADETDQVASFQRLRHLSSEQTWVRGDETVASFFVRAYRDARPAVVAGTSEQNGLPGSTDELSIALSDFCEAVKHDDDSMRRASVAMVRRAVLTQAGRASP